MILESKGIKFQKIDVAADENAKIKMRELSGNPTAIPPQLFNGDTYCGVCLFLYLLALLYPVVAIKYCTCVHIKAVNT